MDENENGLTLRFKDETLEGGKHGDKGKVPHDKITWEDQKTWIRYEEKETKVIEEAEKDQTAQMEQGQGESDGKDEQIARLKQDIDALNADKQKLKDEIIEKDKQLMKITPEEDKEALKALQDEINQLRKDKDAQVELGKGESEAKNQEIARLQ